MKNCSFFSVRFFFLLLPAFFLAACSPSLFNGDKDSELSSLKGDGRFNKLCRGLDLSQETLSVATARGLIGCLNSNGSIQEFEDWTKTMSDEQLKTLVDVANEQLLTNHIRLKELDRSFTQLDSKGLFDPTLRAFSKILKHSKMARNTLKLLRNSVASPEDPAGKKLDPAVLEIIRILSEELSSDRTGQVSVAKLRENAARALEMGVSATSLESYRAMVRGLSSSVPTVVRDHGLEYFTSKALQYLQRKIDEPLPLAKTLLWGIEDGSLYRAFDIFNYESCEGGETAGCGSDSKKISLNDQIRGIELFLRVTNLEDREGLLKPMVELFRTLDARIDCMGGSKEVPNANLFVMDELAKLQALNVPEWISRDNLLKIKLANSLCKFPVGSDGSSFNSLINVLRRLAEYSTRDEFGNLVEHRPLISIAHFLRALMAGEKIAMSEAGRLDLKSAPSFDESKRYRRLMIDLLGDKNRDVNLYSNISEMLGELSRVERAVVGNLFYLLNAQSSAPQDRADIQNAVRFLLKLRPELRTENAAVPGSNPKSARSIHDVMSNSLKLVETKTLVEIVKDVSQIIDERDEIANTLLKNSREAILTNSVNPVLEILLGIGRDPKKYENLFNTLFDVTDSDQFERAVLLAAKMAENGTLKELLQGTLNLFKATVNRVPGEPALVVVPPVNFTDPSRDQSTYSRGPWIPLAPKWTKNPAAAQACNAVDLDLPFGKPFEGGDFGRVRWEEQLKNIAACTNSDAQNVELAEWIHYALSKKITQEKSLLGWVVEQAAEFIPDGPSDLVRAVFDEFSDLLVDENKVKDVKNMNELLPYFFSKSYCSAHSESPGFRCPEGVEQLSLSKAFFRLLSVLAQKTEPLQKVLNLGAKVVERKELPKAITLLHDVSTEAEEAAKDPRRQIVADKKPPLVSFPIDQYPSNQDLKKITDAMILKYENPKSIDERRQQLVAEYWRQTLPYEVSRYKDYKGVSRIGFGKSADLKRVIKPFLDELAKGNRLEWFMVHFFYMDHSPYTPEWWADWFRRLSAEVRPMPYYWPGTFPGVDKAQVRLVSMLDILDLIVEEADFSLREMGESAGSLLGKDMDENTAIKYLTLLARSGNNLDPVMDAMYRETAFFQSIADRLPFVLKPETKRRLFNLTHVYEYFKTVIRMHRFVGSDGRVVVANDLWILRDLFKSVLSATPNNDPRKNPTLYHKDKNSLAVVCGLVRTGLLRNAALNMFQFTGDGRVALNPSAHIFSFLFNAGVDLIDDPKGGVRKINPNTLALLSHLVRGDCDRSKSKYKNSCLQQEKNETFNERYVFIGRLFDQFFEWTADDDRRDDEGQVRIQTLIKRSGFHLMQLLSRMEIDESGVATGLAKTFASLNRHLLGSSQATSFLGSNLDLLNSIISDEKAPIFLRLLLDAEFSEGRRGSNQFSDREEFIDFRKLILGALSDASNSEGEAAAAISDLMGSLDRDQLHSVRTVRNIAKWQDDDRDLNTLKTRIQFERIKSDLARWFSEETVDDARGKRVRAFRPRLQKQLAQQMRSGDLSDLLQFVARETRGENGAQDALNSKLQFLGDRTYVQKLNDFTDLLRAGIVDTFSSLKH